MLLLSSKEHGKSLHNLVSSLIYSFKDLKFLLNRSFTYLVSGTPRYFMSFVAIVKDDVSFISFSASLSFVYGRVTDYFERNSKQFH